MHHPVSSAIYQGKFKPVPHSCFLSFLSPLIFIVAMHEHHPVSKAICQRMIQHSSHLCWLLCFGTEAEMTQTELVLLCLSDMWVNRCICLIPSTFNLCWLVCIEALADMAKTELALLHPIVNWKSASKYVCLKRNSTMQHPY